MASGAVTELALTIIEDLASDLQQAKTINQIAKSCGKAYPNVHATVRELLKEDILRKETVGHAHNCRLNLGNETTALYIALIQARRAGPIPEDIDHEDAVLVWKTGNGFLLITEGAASGKGWMSLKEFLADEELFATINRHALLKGHTYYARLLTEEAK